MTQRKGDEGTVAQANMFFLINICERGTRFEGGLLL